MPEEREVSVPRTRQDIVTRAVAEASRLQDEKEKAKKQPRRSSPAASNGNGKKSPSRKPPAAEPPECLTLAEPYPWPGVEAAWVHPVSQEDADWAIEHAAARVVTDANQRKETLTAGQLKVRCESWERIYHVIAALRVGPEEDADLLLTEDDADDLRFKAVYRVPVLAVCAVSARLGTGEYLRSAFEAFFDGALAVVASLLSRSNEGWTATCQADLTHLSECLQLTRQRGVLDSAVWGTTASGSTE